MVWSGDKICPYDCEGLRAPAIKRLGTTGILSGFCFECSTSSLLASYVLGGTISLPFLQDLTDVGRDTKGYIGATSRFERHSFLVPPYPLTIRSFTLSGSAPFAARMIGFGTKN